jgi:RHS repeat-associated protein
LLVKAGSSFTGSESGGAWRNGLTDLVGSPIEYVDTAGLVSTPVHYDPFGTVRPGSTAQLGIGYAGEFRDAAGLINLRARAYDPLLSRFVSRDTFGGLAAEPQTANPYSYALGNPLRYTDPSGHFVNNIVANPRVGLFGASFVNPWVAIGLGVYVSATGYDPIFNTTLSPGAR